MDQGLEQRATGEDGLTTNHDSSSAGQVEVVSHASN